MRLPLPAFATATATAIVASLALATPSAHAADCAGADLLPAVASVPAARTATLCLINEQRTARGLSALGGEPELQNAATAYSETMVRQGFFAHISPLGESLGQRLAAYAGGAQVVQIAENLAWGEGAQATPRGVVGGWMNSDAHRSNILSATMREVGIGIAAGSPRGSLPAVSATYTAHFGTRANSPSMSTEASGTIAIEADYRPAASKRVSSATKRRIKKDCTRITRKTRSKAARKTRYNRCVDKRMRAARAA